MRDFDPDNARFGSSAPFRSQAPSGPLCPNERALAHADRLAGRCQDPTRALQQTTCTGFSDLLDKVVGTLLKQRRHVEAEGLGGL